MRPREKICVILIGLTLVLGIFIYSYFHNNEVEANYFRWLFANNLKHGADSPMEFISTELPSGSLLFGGLTIFAVVILIFILRTLRDGEVQALKKRLMDVGAAKTEAEGMLQEEVWKGKHERQAKDSVMRDLETSIERIERLIGEVNEKEMLLRTRDEELITIKSKAAEESDEWPARPAPDRKLHDALQKQTDSVEAKNAEIKTLESRLAAKSRLWESQLREKDALLRGRDTELEGIKSELQSFNDRLEEMEGAKKRAEELLENELRQKKKVLAANDLAIKTEQKRLNEKIQALEAAVDDQDKILNSRDAESAGFKKQLNELAAAKEAAEARLREELGKAHRDRSGKDNVAKDLEQTYRANLRNLQNEMAEKDLLLEFRDNELTTLKTEVTVASVKLDELAAAKAQAEGLLREELRKEQQRRQSAQRAGKELEDRYAGEIANLQSQLGEREKSVRSHEGEIKLLKAQVSSLAERLAKSEAAKEQAAGSLQERIRKERESQQGSDSAVKSLEAGFKAKIGALEKQLAEKQQSAGSPDREVLELRAQVQAVNQRMAELAQAKEKAESLFQAALEDKTELVQANDAARKETEGRATKDIQSLGAQLREKDELLQGRESELATARRQLAELGSSKASLRALQEAVKQKTELAETKEATLKALEDRADSRVRSLESQLAAKDKLLEKRDTELKAIAPRVAKLVAQIAEVGAAKDQDERSLREELRKRMDLLEERESGVKALEERLSGQIHELENRLGEKSLALDSRDSEIDKLQVKLHEATRELSELGGQNDRATSLLQEELREKTALLEAKESSVNEAEGQFGAKVKSLERQVVETRKLLEVSGAELGEMRSEIYVLTEKLGEAEGAKIQAEALLQEERTKASQAMANVNVGAREGRESGAGDGVEILVSERAQLLKARDKLIQDLMNELKEKKTQLAKHEIGLYREAEKRDAWKHRLSKFGIRMRD